MQEIDPQNSQDYYILATSSRADERTRVIKHGETFAVFDMSGTMRPEGYGELGIYHDGTRFLSTFELAIARRRTMLLGSTVRSDGVLVIDLANPDIPDFPGGALDRDSIHIAATHVLWAGAWYLRLRVHNYARRRIDLDIGTMFGADFADVFEVRGVKREHRGVTRVPIITHDGVTLGYDGLDGRGRTTRLEFTPAPRRITATRAEIPLQLEPDASATVDLRAGFGVDRGAQLLSFDTALENVVAEASQRRRHGAVMTSSNERFDAWIERSTSDLQMMVTQTAHGPYPYAGVPWFSTPFGRDGLITAYELLWLDPELARGVLRFLAATQATAHEPERDAEPGKIVHELRLGEMAALDEVPFGRYYGSIDATPLFVMLAAEYWRRTADRDAVAVLWPHVVRALHWLDVYGDIDRDGFVEYAARTPRGLVAQGWKDSNDSISCGDGRLAEGPIALCEVQGYVYAARRGAAELARVLGHDATAAELDAAADSLRDHFERAFWSERLGTYVIALDGHKRQCDVRSSNPGHLLWTGIVDHDRAVRVTDTLFAPTTFTGWGLRTLDATAPRFNPISYHNGSIWPHDNALCAIGMSRYGLKAECVQLLCALFEASHYFDLGRTPELFCGFARRPSQGPVMYPVACAPQAWSAGAVFLLVQACLGIGIDAPRGRVLFDRPLLPRGMTQLTIRDLHVGSARLDLACRAVDGDIAVHVLHREGDVEVAELRC